MNTIASVLEEAQRKWGNKPHIYTRQGESYTAKTVGELAEDVYALSKALLSQGLEGKHIMVISENSYEWMVFDLACSGFVGVSAAGAPHWTLDQFRQVIDKTDIACVFYSEAFTWLKDELEEEANIPFYFIEKEFPNLLEQGRSMNSQTLEGIPHDRYSKIFYTSGTRGLPKAAMLSQKNLFAGLEPLYARAPFNEQDICYLFLPLHHTYGGIYNFLYSLVFGFPVYLCSDLSKLAEELVMVSPTVFCAVPAVLSRFYHAVQEAPEPPKALVAAFGGKMRYLFHGGSPFSPSLRKYYRDAGLNVLDGYGLTETCSSLAIQYSDTQEYHASGTAFENLDIKIDKPNQHGEGEILVRGDAVFSGYYKRPDLTAEVLDEDGYFHSGDIGSMDEQRRIFLKGRKDEIISTARGELINPIEIEQLLLWKGNLEYAKIYEQDGKLIAKISPQKEEDFLKELMQAVNKELPRYMWVEGWSIESSPEEQGWKR